LSIQYTTSSSAKYYATSAQTVINQSQTSTGLGFWINVSSLSLTTNCQIVGTYPIVYAMLVYVNATMYYINFYSYWTGGTHSTFQSPNLTVGKSYHILLSINPNSQTLYCNGVAGATAAINLATATGSDAFAVGPENTSTGVILLDQVSSWNGYAPTQADVADLLFGVSPLSLGTPPSFYWTLDGSGSPSLGAGGLACTNATYNLSAQSGTGSAVYGATLSYTSTVSLLSAYVCCSGKTISVRFQDTGTQAPLVVSAASIVPTISVNGGDPIQIVNPGLITGKHTCALFSLPSGTDPIVSTDAVTLTSADGWVSTSEGLAMGLTAQALTNRVGKSSVGADQIAYTLPVGVNINWAVTGNATQPAWVEKNMRFRIGSWTGVSAQSNDGYPTTIAGTTAWTTFNQTNNNANGIDNTHYPVASGYYAVGWDDLPGSTTTFTITDNVAAHNVTVTPASSYNNPGINGVGKVVVFNAQYVGNPPDLAGSLIINLINPGPGQNCTFSNLVIYGPGDFTLGTPTVLDRSDPYAISAGLLSRLPSTLGSLRMGDATLNSGMKSWIARKEDMRQPTHFSWGSNSYARSYTIPFLTADPWNSTTYPWAYTSDTWGSSYSCTLAGNITTTPVAGTQEVYTFSDAQNAPTASTGPVLAGLKIKDKGETMRVLSVSGTSVTLERGSEGTTPVTHSSGVLAISGRAAITPSTLYHAGTIQITCASDHQIISGQSIQFPNWGSAVHFSMQDGSNSTFAGAAYPMFCLDHKVVLMWYGGTTTGTTMSSSVDLSAYSSVWSMPNYACVPYEFQAKIATALSGCDIHVCVGYVMDDDCIMDVARRIRDNTIPGRNVWVEWADEPWNSVIGNQALYCTQVSQLITGNTSFTYQWQVTRSVQVKQLFINVFNENGLNRGGEIKILLNIQKTAYANAQSCLNYAISQGNVEIDAIAIAPYVYPSTYASSLQDYWNYDDDQVAGDLLSHDLWYNTDFNGTSGQAPWAQQMQAVIAAYNTSTGYNCVLYGYEIGLSQSLPKTTTSLTASIDNQPTSTILTVASTANFVINQYIVVDYPSSTNLIPTTATELMEITGITDSTHFTVARGVVGLALGSQIPVAHNSGALVRSCSWERDSDIFYNPNYRQCEIDTYVLYQTLGYHRVNIYSLLYLAPPQSDWSCYWAQGQLPGKGDGSDGKADNRLNISMPQQANSKSYTMNPHATNVSVRGQALLDYYTALAPAYKPIYRGFLARRNAAWSIPGRGGR